MEVSVDIHQCWQSYRPCFRVFAFGQEGFKYEKKSAVSYQDLPLQVAFVSSKMPMEDSTVVDHS